MKSRFCSKGKHQSFNLKKQLSNILKFLLFFSIGAIILYLVYLSQNEAYQEQCVIDGISPEDCNLLQKVWTDVKGANYFWILMVLLVYVTSNVSRAARWLMLIQPMGYRPKRMNAFHTVMLGYFANLGLPRMGEIVRAGVFSKYENIPVEKVMGTVVTDRIVDVISLAVVIALAFALEFDTLWNFVMEERAKGEGAESGSNWISWLIYIGGILGVVGGLLIIVFFKKIRQTAIYQKILNILKGFAEGIQSIRKLDRPGWFIFHSFNIWFCYFLMTWLGTLAFAPTAELGMIAGLTIFVAGALGMVIPAPGGMGSYHALVIGACALYGVSGNDAFSFANILFFSIQVGANVLLGIIALMALPVINRGYKGSGLEKS